MVVNGVVAWWKGGVVVCHRLVATSHLVGVKNEAGRVVVPAYLGWAQPHHHHPHLQSTRCACWGLVTWHSGVILVVAMGGQWHQSEKRYTSPPFRYIRNYKESPDHPPV